MFKNFLSNTINKIDPKISLSDESENNTANMYNQLLKAGYYTNMGKATKALNSFGQVFTNQPSVYVYEPFIKLLFEMGDIKKVLEIYSDLAAFLQFELQIAHSFPYLENIYSCLVAQKAY